MLIRKPIPDVFEHILPFGYAEGNGLKPERADG
jgi:hypothetical protein